MLIRLVGSGTACKATINFTSGVVTLITIAEDQGGTGYKKGDVLTVTGGNVVLVVLLK